MLLLEVLLVGDDRLDGQYWSACLPHRLSVLVDVSGRVCPVIVWDGPDHALKTNRVNFNVEVCLAGGLNLHAVCMHKVVCVYENSFQGKFS